jgi:hypothetical protein
MAMQSVTASVPTTHGGRYLQQLCKHWSHRISVEFTAEAGVVTFPNGAVLTMTAQPAALDVRLELPEGEDVERMEGVVASHLDRFAFREAPLSFVWVNA